VQVRSHAVQELGEADDAGHAGRRRLGGQGGDERRPPPGDEAVVGMERAQAREPGVDDPQFLTGPGEFVDADVPGDVAGARQVAGVVPSGRLRVSLPLGGMFLMPLVADFMEAYPAILLDLDFSDRLVDVIEEGFDVVVIASSMINFAPSSILKAWLDHIVWPGRTVAYSETGPKGLLTGKKVYLVIASGGIYSVGPAQPHDFQGAGLGRAPKRGEFPDGAIVDRGFAPALRCSIAIAGESPSIKSTFGFSI